MGSVSSMLSLQGQPAPESAPRFTFAATVEQVLMVASVFFVLAANRPFFAAAMHGHDVADASTWGFVLALGTLLMSAHFLMMALVANRWTLKPVLAVLIVATAVATYFMARYSVYFDATMVRNVLRTDPGEARELLSPALLPHLLLYAVLPLALLARVRIVNRPLLRAVLVRALALLLAAAASVASVLAASQPFASLMRNHREVRYLITPGNVVWSLGAVSPVIAILRPARGSPRTSSGRTTRPSASVIASPRWSAPRSGPFGTPSRVATSTSKRPGRSGSTSA